MATPTTLSDAFQISRATLNEAISQTIIDTSPIMNFLVFQDAPQMKYEFGRDTTLPDPAHRAINSAYSDSDGAFTSTTKDLLPFGTKFKMDRKLTQVRNFDRNAWLANQMELHTRAIALDFKKNIFTGTGGGNMEGLETLATETVNFNGVNGGFMNDAEQLINDFNAAISAGRDVPDVIACKRAVLDRINALTVGTAANAALAGIFEWTVIEINGRKKRIGSWSGIPMIPLDVDSDDAEILAFDKTLGTSSDTTDAYFISAGIGRHLLLQDKPMEVVMYEADDGTGQTVVMDWAVEQVLEHPKAVVKLQGLRDPANEP